MEARDIEFETIRIGDSYTFSKTWSKEDVQAFATLSGDENPLHTDERYAEATSFGRIVVHGMLTASLCSTLVGMYLPGKRNLYLSQSLFFKSPVYAGDQLTVTGTVISKSESARVLGIRIVIQKGDTVVLEGEANVTMI